MKKEKRNFKNAKVRRLKMQEKFRLQRIEKQKKYQRKRARLLEPYQLDMSKPEDRRIKEYADSIGISAEEIKYKRAMEMEIEREYDEIMDSGYEITNH